MHPSRLPVPDLWEDILQKIKAMGLRMVSMNIHWAFHPPAPGRVDQNTGPHNITRFLEMARELTEEGTVIMYRIKNEYGNQWLDATAKVPNPEPVSYMEELEDNARRNGIVVPLIHNSPNLNSPVWSQDYVTVGAGGDVDIYGVDNYPQCWSCVLEECGNVTPWAVSDYFGHFEKKISIPNLYMIYGGTNWGWLAAPFIGSSYDYGAAISEDRSIDDKFYEIKNLGLFTRAANELALTERAGTGLVYTKNTNLFTTELRNPEIGARVYVIRHNNTASDSEEWFILQVKISIGEFYVPKMPSAVVLSGHEGKALVADFHSGNHTLYYATAEVLTYSIIDDSKAVLVLWTPSGRSGEFFLRDWKVHDGLPERFHNYTDTGPAWILANASTTPNPVAGPDTATTSSSSSSLSSSGDDNTRPPRPTGVFLNVRGHGARVFGVPQRGVPGLVAGTDGRGGGGRRRRSALREGENVLLVVHDDTGHDQLEAAANPRGGGGGGGGGGGTGFSAWKVAGTAGGSAAPDRAGLDRVLRTRYNEGGLAAERLGWHQRGIDDSAWETAEGPTVGFEGPGVPFFRGWLPLDVPRGIELSLALRFKPAEEDVERGNAGVQGSPLRQRLAVREDTFPVPPGVLDYSGDNLIGLAVWSLQEEGARVDLDVVVG
ncbi:hypothetical protein L209DRAFT_776464 [Thermothelomyces heterothallicus CBS 203.75]